MKLTLVEKERFRKQELMPFIGKEGMEKIKDTTILMIGMGGGGCAASLQFATSNVGRLILCDFDTVGNSNLGRQFLHNEATLGIEKVISAQIALKQINPSLEIETISEPINRKTLEEVSNKYQNLAIFVAVDQFQAHYLINDFCIKNHIPAVHIAQLGYKGFIYTYDPNQSHTGIESAINQFFNKKVDTEAFDKDEQDLPYFAPIISIVCGTGVVEILKMQLNLTSKTLANTFLIYRALEHEDIFESEQSKKPFFEENQLLESEQYSLCQETNKGRSII
jgi:adenylyltransferase/sulfurtransferase